MSQSAFSAIVSTRAYFSSYYLWSAQHHARLAAEIEEAHPEGGGSLFSIRHRAYVLGAITDAVAFVEAAINEVLQDVADDHESYIQPLDKSARERLKGFWAAGAMTSTLTKYEDSLRLCEQPQMPKGSAPWQDMAVLVSLRNELVHYKPADVSDSFEPSNLARRLGGKFANNVLMAEPGNAWFPDKALGAGSASWACLTARAFVDAWSGKLGLTLNYQRVTWDEDP